jgi:hypothetical protein
MNVFYLHKDPYEAARLMCDKHTPKMPVESGQMLSTVHRYCDGTETIKLNKAGRRMKHWYLDDSLKESLLYKVAHLNHPSTIWTRQSDGNYAWHWHLFRAMLEEYTFRYGKVHKSSELLDILKTPPTNIPKGDFAPPPQCMPEQYKQEDAVIAYRNYYIGEKAGFAKWQKGRSIPEWFNYDNIQIG